MVIKCEVQEIKQDDKDEAGQAHRDETKDPRKQRKGEVEGMQSERPEIAPPNHHLGNISIVMFMGNNIDEVTCMAIVPYRLHVGQESNHEAHQYG